MKANKFFAVALAALTLVGFNACKPGQGGGSENPDQPGQEAELALDKTSLSLEVGEEATITATIEVSFESSNPAAATVTPANDGKSAKVTAVAEGSAIITAKSQGGQAKTCVVAVKKAGGEGGGGAQLKGSQIWPLVLDGTTADANASKIVADFRPNDVDQFLYVWDETYDSGAATGMNFHGNTDGYTAMIVSDDSKWVTTGNDWSGAGFCLTADGTGWQAAEALRAAIVANPDDYFLHIAIKSTDNFSHCFYIFGAENTTKFILGSKVIYAGKVYQDFTRDGAWHEFDIPMSTYASALANTTCAAGVNVLCVLTEGVPGAQLNLDAVYFYKK